jgi:hypothetical protein
MATAVPSAKGAYAGVPSYGPLFHLLCCTSGALGLAFRVRAPALNQRQPYDHSFCPSRPVIRAYASKDRAINGASVASTFGRATGSVLSTT